MAQFLVIWFDRYDTRESSHRVIEADTHQQAAFIFYEIEDSHEKQEAYLKYSTFGQVDEIFACEAGEESDLLIYKIS